MLALSDHNTGGLSIGNYASDGIYSQMNLETLLGPLRKMKSSAAGMCREIGTDKSAARVQAVVKEGWWLDITEDEAGQILNRSKSFRIRHYALGEVICPKYTAIGWTTHGHCGGDVPLFAFGPGKPSEYWMPRRSAGSARRPWGLTWTS